MEYSQVIIRKREDMGKVYLFFPHTGIVLEAECRDVKTLGEVLELIEGNSIEEVKKFCSSKWIPNEIFDKAKAILDDLNNMGIKFDK